MKTYLRILMALSIICLGSCSENVTPQHTYEPSQPVSIQVFYNQLSPFGTWVNYPTYGHVWIPDVPWGFSPYATHGQWIYTRYGWTWNSDYAWGWAPFHYGRWFFDSGYGWMWIPDTVWGPAWVIWRNGGGYCGWAPLAPAVSIHIVITGGHPVPHDHWVFVRDRDFSIRPIERHRVDRSQNIALVERAPLMKNIREERQAPYMPGPEREEIQRATNHRVDQIQIIDRSSPGTERLRNNQLEIFRPSIDKDLTNREKPAPDRVFKLDEINKRSDGPGLRRQGQLRMPSDTRPQVKPSQPFRKIQTNPPSRENRSNPTKKFSPAKPNPRRRGG